MSILEAVKVRKSHIVGEFVADTNVNPMMFTTTEGQEVTFSGRDTLDNIKYWLGALQADVGRTDAKVVTYDFKTMTLNEAEMIDLVSQILIVGDGISKKLGDKLDAIDNVVSTTYTGTVEAIELAVKTALLAITWDSVE